MLITASKIINIKLLVNLINDIITLVLLMNMFQEQKRFWRAVCRVRYAYKFTQKYLH